MNYRAEQNIVYILKMCADSSKLKAKFKGGGSIIELPPVFSEDNQ